MVLPSSPRRARGGTILGEGCTVAVSVQGTPVIRGTPALSDIPLGELGVRPASELASTAGVELPPVFPVLPELAGLLPRGGLPASGTVVVRNSVSLLLALLAAATAAGSWAAVVGMPELGIVAAAELGVAVHRLALVPSPGEHAPAVISALLDGMDLVAVGGTVLTGSGTARVARQLSARARHRGAVLLPCDAAWPGADLQLASTTGEWSGIARGSGRLRERRVELVVSGRGAAFRVARVPLLLPGPHGEVAAAEPRPRTAGPATAPWLVGVG